MLRQDLLIRSVPERYAGVVTVDPDSPVASYAQVAEAIRAAIDAGVYGASGRLPSARALKEQFQVSGSTIDRAVRELQLEGRVYTTQRGTFVGAGPKAEPTDTSLASQVADLAKQVHDLAERVAAIETSR